MIAATKLDIDNPPEGGIKVFSKREWQDMDVDKQGKWFRTHNILLVKEENDRPLVRVKNWDFDSLDGKFDLDTFVQVQSELISSYRLMIIPTSLQIICGRGPSFTAS